MGIQNHQFIISLLVISALSLLVFAKGNAITPSYAISFLNRRSFPADFRWGAASSAYQIEGAANTSGKGPSIWDTFTHRYPEKISGQTNADVACDSYHKYKEDVKILKHLNMNSYRFSISWSRLLPRGKLSGGVNEEGIGYYNNLINELLTNGIEPYATLFHWDVPQALEDEYGGFLSKEIADDFGDFADLCFKRFGDRVKHWITLNEPWTFAHGAYVQGFLAPGRCSYWVDHTCTGGDSATEPYIVTHNQLLAHAAAVRVYRTKYQKSQNGEIGITLVSTWVKPLSDSEQNLNARQRALDFKFGWFMDPITTGDYPETMRLLVGNRLPKFSPEQSNMLKGSFDFLGLNYYTAEYAQATHFNNSVRASYDSDSQTNLLSEKNGVPIGETPGSAWLQVYPEGILDLLQYINEKYNSPRIFITENGVDQLDNSTMPLTIREAVNDTVRIKYYHDHLSYILQAMRHGVKVEGYFAWSLLDNFEWIAGYTSRFGIYYVDYKHKQRRIPKFSSTWLRDFLRT